VAVRVDQRRADVRRWPAVLLLLFATACGGSPLDPDPPPPPPPPPPPAPVNVVPIIDSITISAERVEADGEITVTAAVRDSETAIDQLRLEWSASAGTFTGSGLSVRWRAPKGPATPADYVLTLTVTEMYGSGQQHIVRGTSSSVRVHDSPVELRDMAMRFLNDFANSSVSADVAVREFADSCPGKRDEQDQIADNRRKYTIQSAQLTRPEVRVKSPTTGEVRVRCEFRSTIKNCRPSDGPGCKVGALEHVLGDCDLSTVYEQRRWWLCTSHFNNGVLLPSMRPFRGWR
jgi:hypothetical protein